VEGLHADVAAPAGINPSKGFIASWNNSPAAGWWAADGHGSYGPVHRVDMLVDRLKAFQATGKKFDFGGMVESWPTRPTPICAARRSSQCSRSS
jgi:hypothetical protein